MRGLHPRMWLQISVETGEIFPGFKPRLQRNFQKINLQTKGKPMFNAQELKNRLNTVRCFAIDLDGTIFLGDSLFDCTLPFLEKIFASRRRYIFVTNNSSLAPEAFLEKFRAMGLREQRDRLYTSADATAEYLLTYGPGHRLCVLGTDSLIRFFEQKGFLIEPDEPDALVLGFDLDFDYSRLLHATRLVRRGVPFFATHPDMNCPVENGDFLPDCGAIAAAITAATGVGPKFFGKPYPAMIEGILERTGVERSELAIIGDRLSTDILMGMNSEVLTILVLTGETRLCDLQSTKIRPNFVVPSLADLIDLL